MAKLKRLAAFCTAAVMAWSMTGCSDTSYVMSSNGENVKAGVYIFNMLNTMNAQMMMMYYQDGITDNYMDQEVDGKKFSEYLSEQALKSTKEYTAVVQKFEELGLELTDDEIKDINSQINDSWNKKFYEKQGISKESIKLVQKASLMRSKIFDYYYAEGGIEAVSDDDMNKYITDNYLRYKRIYIAKSTEEDEEAAKAADEENKKLRDEYLKKAEGLSFKDFDTVIDEYNDYLNSESEENADSSDNLTTDGDESSVDDVSSLSDESSAAGDESNFSDSVESSLADESLSETADSTSGDESQAGLASDAADGEEDPYVNEIMTNYGSLKEDELKETNGKLLTEINKLEVGKASAYEDENAYYIIIKGDASERAAEYAEENHDQLLVEMKTEDFQALLDEWVEKCNIKLNDKAINRYTPEIVYDKYIEQSKSAT